MSERDADGPGRHRSSEQTGSDGLAAEVRASALLIALVVVATVAVAVLAHLLLRSGS